MKTHLSWIAALALAILPGTAFSAFSISPSVTTSGTGTLTINSIAVDDVTKSDVFEGTGALNVDMPVDVPALTGVVDAGTPFSSYMFNVSQSGDTTQMSYTLTITFDNPIIGIQTSSGFLSQGYTYLLDNSSTYVTAGSFDAIAPEGNYNGDDSITIQGDTITVVAKGRLTNGTDPFRVLTAVPEMTTILSWAGLAGIGCVLYRRSRK
ncbi:hypothetical protein [Aeoliella mucimassa]|uniref:PEP-CTERM protein-sorting domain-containing protein n=1 Tax=Aeoliella mucimassa TaxID=2527972 RepID=A0A518AK13_9BACT|nr:hypothetical protein [Aeoliella mucimassa]QDU55071.1 hypothetical protein Pan181_12570 [Aeoliella mucimassa]